MERARAVAADGHAPEHERVAMLDLLGELKDRASVGLLLDLTTHDDNGERGRPGRGVQRSGPV